MRRALSGQCPEVSEIGRLAVVGNDRVSVLTCHKRDGDIRATLDPHDWGDGRLIDQA